MINKKNISIIFAAVLFLIISGAIIVYFSQPKPQSNTKKEVVVHHISLTKDKATPDALSIKLGELVQFNSKDGGYHNMAQGQGDEFEENHEHPEESIDSGIFGPDEAYKVDLKQPGVYHFHDHNNPDIYSTIIVTQ